MYKNQIVLEGFLGNDPEPRTLPSGDVAVNLSLATKEFWKDRTGQPVEATEWHRLVFFAARADRAGDYQKGDNIHVEGKAITRRYTDAQDHPKTVHEVIVMRSHRIDRGLADDDAEDAPRELDQDSPGTARAAGSSLPHDTGMASF